MNEDESGAQQTRLGGVWELLVYSACLHLSSSTVVKEGATDRTEQEKGLEKLASILMGLAVSSQGRALDLCPQQLHGLPLDKNRQTFPGLRIRSSHRTGSPLGRGRPGLLTQMLRSKGWVQGFPPASGLILGLDFLICPHTQVDVFP